MEHAALGEIAHHLLGEKRVARGSFGHPRTARSSSCGSVPTNWAARVAACAEWWSARSAIVWGAGHVDPVGRGIPVDR